MSKFADLAALASTPRVVTPLEVARAAAQAVQSSLFVRLRRARGGPLAGRLAWMLVRAGQPEHDDSGDALAALAGFPDLSPFLEVACRARDSLASPAAARLAASVVRALEVEAARRVAGVGSGGVGGVG